MSRVPPIERVIACAAEVEVVTDAEEAAAIEEYRFLRTRLATAEALLREAMEQTHDYPCGSGSDNAACLGCRIEAFLNGAKP